MQAYWTIELLGGLSAVRDGERTSRFATQKTGSLLAYLAFYRKKALLRETLAEMLWPDVDPSQGRALKARLHTALQAADCDDSGTLLSADEAVERAVDVVRRALHSAE